MILKRLLFLACLSVLTTGFAQESNEEGRGAYKTRTLYNLEQYWDDTTVLKNPHKGWELHYFDNGIKQYGTRLTPDDLLEDFPGLNSVYLRLAWSYLAPEEGKFNWTLIDTVNHKWAAKGVAGRKQCGSQKVGQPLWLLVFSQVRRASRHAAEASDQNYLQMTWENHGVAPAYHRYDARLQPIHKQSGKVAVFELG